MVFQLSVLVGLVYFIYSRLARQGQTDSLLKGLLLVFTVFIGLWLFSRFLALSLLETVFGASIQLLIIGLIVIFQPELRRLLLVLGQAELFALSPGVRQGHGPTRLEDKLKELKEAVRFMARSRVGALLVLEPPESSDSRPDGAYLEAGVPLDAQLSMELILTIFHPNTPLHDGAVVLNADLRVTAAGVLLPLTEEPNLSWRYGTRHRAAIGLTEVSPSHCVVVSEETGTISYVAKGHIERLASTDELLERLRQYYGVKDENSATTVQDSRLVTRLADWLPGWENQTLRPPRQLLAWLGRYPHHHHHPGASVNNSSISGSSASSPSTAGAAPSTIVENPSSSA